MKQNMSCFWALTFSAFLLVSAQKKAVAQCSTANPAACFCPTPGATNCLLLPDILAGKHSLNSSTGWTEYNQIINGVNKGLLRIDVSTPNVGWGPLEVSPTNDYVCGNDTLRNFTPPGNFLCPDGGYPKRLIKQKLYQKNGNTFDFVLRDAGWMQYHPSHGHIHIEGWGLYTIRLQDASIMDTLQWPIVNSGIKVSFCLIDLTTCSGSLGDCRDANGNVLNNASFPNYGLGGGYSCGNIKQGISVGKVDIYDQSLDESFIRIPYEACNGNYIMMVQIDPDNHFLEMNDNNNWLASPIPLVKQRTTGTGTGAYAYIFSKKGNVICPGGSLELEASGASNYLWSHGTTTQKTSITAPGKYWVRATTPCGTTTSDTLIVSEAGSNGVPATMKGDTICNGEKARLFASGNAHWFDAPTNGNLVFIGNNFETGTLSANTTFYVVDQPSLLDGTLGPTATNFSGAGNFTTPKSDYLIFNAFLPFKLKKVTVNANTAGSRIFELRTIYGEVLAQKQVALVAGEQEVLLDFFVPSGLNLQLGLGGASPVAGLYSSTTTATNIGYPYKLKSVANIVGSSLGDKILPFCYKWQIEGTPQACVTGNAVRTPVTAVVLQKPLLTIGGLAANYPHSAGPSLLTVNPPGGVLSGPGIVGNNFFPKLAGVGSHAIQYQYNQAKCSTAITLFTTVEFNRPLLTNGFAIELFNNPGDEPMLYVVSPLSSSVRVRLLSNTGQLLETYNFTANSGSNWFKFTANRLPKGLYFVQVLHTQSGNSRTLKLLN